VNRILFTALAENDIEDIWVGIALDNEPAADRLVHNLHAALRRVATFPGMGRVADHIRSDARAFVHGNYVIVYRRMHYGIAVLRIVHGARNIELIEVPPAPREVREEPFIYARDVFVDAALRFGDLRLRISQNKSPLGC
jgi:toxin ParE1/3/4